MKVISESPHSWPIIVIYDKPYIMGRRGGHSIEIDSINEWYLGLAKWAANCIFDTIEFDAVSSLSDGTNAVCIG